LPELVRGLVHDIEEHPRDSAAYARLGDTYLFEMNWLTRAREMFEKASTIDEENPGYHWRLHEIYINLSIPERALHELKILAPPPDFRLGSQTVVSELPKAIRRYRCAVRARALDSIDSRTSSAVGKSE
jgi:hypothetical protein